MASQKISIKENNPRRKATVITLWIFAIGLIVFAVAAVLIFKIKMMMYIFAIIGALTMGFIAVMGIREIYEEMFNTLLDLIEKRKE